MTEQGNQPPGTGADRRPQLPEGHRRNYLTSDPRGGRLLSALQLPLFTLRPPRGYGVLTTIGRKTGKQRRRCVRAIRVGETAYLAAIGGPGAQWLRNLRANPNVTLRTRDGAFNGRARELEDAERATAKAAYCETFHPFELLEYLAHMRGRPTRARMRALHEYWFTTGSPIAIDLAPADG